MRFPRDGASVQTGTVAAAGLDSVLVVVDDQLAMCGSINLDLRSLLLNHEANVVFYGTHEIEWLAEWIETTASAGEAYRARRPGLLRDVAEGLLLTVAFQL